MSDIYDLNNYYFFLPKELIAQRPIEPPDTSRLLILDRKTSKISQDIFKNLINFLDKNDVLVLNDTKVIKARLFANKKTGAKIEVLLVKKNQNFYEALCRPNKRVKIKDILYFQGDFKAKVVEKKENGLVVLDFFNQDLSCLIEEFGKTPLPHYIKNDIELSKYQTVYAKKEGSIACPTAGLHFTEELLNKLIEKNIKVLYVTLHCGLATFRPIKEKDIRNHKIEPEFAEISESVANEINEAKKESKRIIAVGTTTTRILEGCSIIENNKVYLKQFCGEVGLYITPGYKFKIVDSLITNFHTPYSTNLVLVVSFCGLDLIRKAYEYAIKEKFRFFSFGDAMFIV